MPDKILKIVFLAPFGIRPKGTLIARMLPLAVHLQAQGCRVTIVAPPYTNPEDSGRADMVEGVKLVNIRLSRLGSTLGAPLLAWRMYRAMRVEQPDLVHLFKPKGYGGLAAMLMHLLGRLGVEMPALFVDTDDWEGKGGMNDLHDYPLPAKWLYALQEEWLPRQAVGVTAASRALDERMRSFAVSEERLLYLPNGNKPVPPGNGMAIRTRLGLDPGTPVVLLYTRFFEFPQEQLHVVFEKVARAVPGVRFLVVGQGRFGEDQALRAAAEQRGFLDNLVQAGWIEPAQLNDYLAAADLAIYPFADTLLNRCKCPAKLTEILRAGVPVVADAVGQIKEYLRDGEGGRLCPPGDVPAMVDAVVGLLADPAGRRDMGLAGRRYLLDNYDWTGLSQRLLQFYQNNAGTRFDRDM